MSKCPECAATIRLTEVVDYQVEGLAIELHCPRCNTKLKNQPLAVKVKGIAAYSAIILALLGYFWPETGKVAFPLAILAFVVMLVSHLMDQYIKIETPK